MRSNVVKCNPNNQKVKFINVDMTRETKYDMVKITSSENKWNEKK